ncbi:MAG: cobalamin B12-binding domain-containing protein [Leptospirales bacterium]
MTDSQPDRQAIGAGFGQREIDMKFLIKDLSRMTSFSPARIRKWQERYRIFEPNQGSNGYWYYSNEDYLVLRSIQQRLAMGQKLNLVMGLGREFLLANLINDEFTQTEWKLIQLIKDSNYEMLENHLYVERKTKTYGGWVRGTLQPLLQMVGRAWETGFISIAEEHALSRWFHGFVLQSLKSYAAPSAIDWLVVTYPGDPHELGALMHYAILRSRGKKVRFAGDLPREELVREVRAGNYQRISISVVLPQSREKLDSVRAELLAADPDVRVYFGGASIGASEKREMKVANKSLDDKEDSNSVAN